MLHFRFNGFFDAVQAIQAIVGCEQWKAEKITNQIKAKFVDKMARNCSPGMQKLLGQILTRL